MRPGLKPQPFVSVQGRYMAKVTRTARRSAAQVIEHDPGVDRVVHRRDERRRSRCSRRGVAGAPSDLVDAALPVQIWKDGWQIDAGLRGFVEESDACVVGRARLAAPLVGIC
jgi:hypothetical protein